MSSPASSPWVLFGWDLSNIVAQFSLGLRQLLWEPVGGVRERLEAPIALYDGDGNAPRTFNDAGPSSAAPEDCQWKALRVPDELVLHRELSLPAAIEPELASTIELEIHANSPFPEQERLAGWRVIGRDAQTLRAAVVITTRTEIARFLTHGLPPALVGDAVPELWCLSSGEVPIVLPGYGEGERESAYGRALKRIASVAAVVFVLALATLTVPVIVSTMKAAKLESQLVEVRSEVREEMALRDELGAINTLLDTLGEQVSDVPNPRNVLNLLARYTPDSVYLGRVEYEPTRLRISGFAEDAAEYMQLLSEQDWLEDVSSPTAFQRDRRSGRERFTLDAGLVNMVPSTAAPAAVEPELVSADNGAAGGDNDG